MGFFLYISYVIKNNIMLISIQKDKVKFDKGNNKFLVDGTIVPFGTKYELVNEKTQKSMIFHFHHSTGSEWDPNTVWIYKTKDELLSLELSNHIPEGSEKAYLEAKLSH